MSIEAPALPPHVAVTLSKAAAYEHRFRGTGRTTTQLKAAAQRAIFIAPTRDAVDYTKRLAHDIGREDIEVMGPSVLGVPHRFHGLSRQIILDHACFGIVAPRVIDRAMPIISNANRRYEELHGNS